MPGRTIAAAAFLAVLAALTVLAAPAAAQTSTAQGWPNRPVKIIVPTGPGAAFEMAVGWIPRVLYDVEHVVAQAQFRLPFRLHLRSRRSLLIGVTRVSSRKRNACDSSFWGDDDTVVFPHAGVSLQWPMGRHADFRFDAQGMFTFDGELPLVPRAVGIFVWHPGGAR